MVKTLLVIIASLILMGGCRSAPASVVVATDESVIASQSSVDQLQRANDLGRETLRFAAAENRRIGEAIGAGRGGIDGALYALDRYDEFVQELIRRIQQLEYATRKGTREGESPQYGFKSGGNLFLD